MVVGSLGFRVLRVFASLNRPGNFVAPRFLRASVSGLSVQRSISLREGSLRVGRQSGELR